MIVFGSNSKLLTKEAIDCECPNCKNTNATTLYIFQEYMHVFFVPLIPMEKLPVTECNNCKLQLKINQMPPFLINKFLEIKPRIKTPIWTFLGLGLIIITLIIVVATTQL